MPDLNTMMDALPEIKTTQHEEEEETSLSTLINDLEDPVSTDVFIGSSVDTANLVDTSISVTNDEPSMFYEPLSYTTVDTLDMAINGSSIIPVVRCVEYEEIPIPILGQETIASYRTNTIEHFYDLSDLIEYSVEK